MGSSEIIRYHPAFSAILGAGQLASVTWMLLQRCNSKCLFGSTYLNMHEFLEFQDTVTAPQHRCGEFCWLRVARLQTFLGGEQKAWKAEDQLQEILVRLVRLMRC